MRYRVVKRSDDTYKCQWRIFLFWWIDSEKTSTLSRDEQIRFAKHCMAKAPPKDKIKVVWP